MAKVTMKSTKEVMMSEIERLSAELEAAKTGNKTVVESQEEKRVTTVKESAAKIVGMNILAPNIIEGYNNVQEAIKIATKELEEITGIKDAIIKLEAVLIAGEKLSADQKAELTAQNEKLKAEAAEIVANKKAEIAHLEQEYSERKTALEKERKREVEEYTYNLKRERQKENDAWADEKAAREKALADKEAVLNEREMAVDAEEETLKALKTTVEEIPALVVKAKEEGKAEAEKQLAKEKAIEVASVKKNAEWEIKVANMERDRAIEDLKKANDKITSLEAKLEAAYASMNTLATTTVQSTGGVKVLGLEKDK